MSAFIQELKQQLSSLQEELKRRESRWSSTQSRLRQQIDSLRQENSSLRDEVPDPPNAFSGYTRVALKCTLYLDRKEWAKAEN